MYKQFHGDETRSSGDTLTDRQTDRQTDSGTDRATAIGNMYIQFGEDRQLNWS